MAFSANPADGDFTRAGGVMYLAEHGRWVRAGAKGLPFVHRSFYMLNETGDLKASWPRVPNKKIAMQAAWDPTVQTNTRIQIWGGNGAPIDFSGKVDDYHIMAEWGETGVSVNNTAITTQPPTSDGLLLHYGQPSHQGVIGEPHYIHAEFLEYLTGYINIRWTAMLTNSYNTTIQTTGEAVVHTDINNIQAVGLHFEGNPSLSKAAAHTQWF